MSTTTSRRNALALVATLPALAAPAALAGLIPDPIYAAIEDRRLTLAKWMTTPEKPAEEYDTAGNADAEAIRKLFTTVPTTLGGVKALLAYIVECEEQGDTVCETYLDEQDGYELCSNVLPVTLHTAIERLCEATT
jgi:hypothetical protein